jgi:hypothetical protein
MIEDRTVHKTEKIKVGRSKELNQRLFRSEVLMQQFCKEAHKLAVMPPKEVLTRKGLLVVDSTY